MKRVFNKFKQLDSTKKIVIVFITVSFAFILGLTIFNMVSPSDSNKYEASDKIKETVKKEKLKTDQREENTSEERSETAASQVNDDTSNNDNKSSEEVSANKSDNSNSTNTANENKPANSNNSSNNSSNNTEEEKKIRIYMSIVGIDDSVMSNGYIDVKENSSVLETLVKYCSANGIALNYRDGYVSGIGGLNEFDYGNTSGWMYMVNEVSPNVGASAYKLSGNENVVWYYVNYK